MRQFIRHPTDMPIEYDIEDVAVNKNEYLNNISHGGLSFQSNICIEPGSVIDIRIPVREPAFKAKGIVLWCRKNDGHYDVGVEFKEGKTEYGVRMVEQVCYIEHYKREILEKEGRKLSGIEAAAEWVKKYAKDFPS